MNICVTVGHSILKNGTCTSADGRKLGGVLEYKWCKNFRNELKAQLKKKGHNVNVILCPEKKFLSAREEKDYKLYTKRLAYASYDLIIELHLNADSTGKASGCEVLYKSSKGKKYAEKIIKGCAKTFKSRGCKLRNDLYMLNGTKSPCVILETFFCTSKSEYKKAKGKANRTKIAKDIAAELSR